MNARILLATGALGLTAYGKYKWIVQPWYKNWGATEAEVAGQMPLDDRITGATLQTTRAITIAASPEQIWPWLAQLGEPPRGGYYSYTLIEKLMGMDVENAEHILPEYQQLTVGQAIDKHGSMVVQAVEPGKHLVIGPPPTVEELQTTWAFAIRAIDPQSSRLITRVRARWSWGSIVANTPFYSWPMWVVVDPGIFIMERKMLLEIKRLSERLASVTPLPEKMPAAA